MFSKFNPQSQSTARSMRRRAMPGLSALLACALAAVPLVPLLARADEAPAAAPAATSVFDKNQQDAIGGVVKDYLMQHPEVIRDALQELDRRDQAQAAADKTAAMSSYASKIYDSKYQAVLGNPKGDVTLVEFFDYNCSYCKHAHADLKRLMDEDPKLRVVLKEFPVLGPGSIQAAQVALVVNEIAPEKYQAFFDELLMSRGTVDGARALAVATDLGLDAAAIKARTNEPRVAEAINESYELAKVLGIDGTPSYILKDDVVVGAVGYDALKSKIEAVRACGRTSC